MSGLPERDVERRDCLHSAGVRVKYDGGNLSVLCERCRVVLATGGVVGQAEHDAAIRDEALTEALHPEFGYEWREPMPTPSGEMDDGGVIWRAVQQAKAEALAPIRALADEWERETHPSSFNAGKLYAADAIRAALLDGGDQS